MSKELSPNEIVRWRDGPKFFGFKLTQQQEKIASGEIPPPIALSDSGRAKGWLGQQIIEHQQSDWPRPKLKERRRSQRRWCGEYPFQGARSRSHRRQGAQW
jgi:hypothetical protein